MNKQAVLTDFKTPYLVEPMVEPQLLDGHVYVWKAAISDHLKQMANLHRILSNKEQLRSGKFYFEEDQYRYILAHAMLRLLLGTYLSFPPEQLAFGENKYGKPYLRVPRSLQKRVFFNLSHAGDMVALAITRMGAVGVDVEPIRDFENCDQFVERIFSESEKRDFYSLPLSLQNEAFFNCWSRKEAFIKAIGIGLSFPLDKFASTIIPGQKARLIEINDAAFELSDWTMMDFTPRKGYAGAVVVKAQQPTIIYHDWKPATDPSSISWVNNL